MTEDNKLRDLVAEVAAAYFSNSHVGPSDIPTVIKQIADSLTAVGAEPAVQEPVAPAQEAPKKATNAEIRRSITPDALISFEDGKSYKTLKRHLSLRGLTIADYKAKWGLPKDYPAVAASYSARRSEFARSIGLGQTVKAATPTSKPASKPPAKRRTKATAQA
jgi:predicted transcriptional regulator